MIVNSGDEMALYLIRAGVNGELENHFLDNNRVYLRWGGLFDGQDIATFGDYEGIKNAALAELPNENTKKLINGAGQINTFVFRIKIGDWIVLPLKRKAAIAIGKVTSDYQFDSSVESDFRHYRTIQWLNKDVPRSLFDQDMLYSFGAFMTVCQIQRNDAENRIKQLAANNWKRTGSVASEVNTQITIESEDSQPVDLATLAQDQIAALIIRKFAGNSMERLVEGILKAQGFKTWRNPGGTDKSIDILAAQGHLGFEPPKICVQVKSQDTPVDRPTLDQLRGGMKRAGATQGLLVSWGGFKSTVEQEIPLQFFDVRLWDQQELIEQLLAVYDKLDEQLRTEIPLKRVWMVAAPEEEM